VGARDDDRPDRRLGEPAQLDGDPLDAPPGLGVRVEQVAGDEEEIDMLGEGQVDGGLEGGELTLPLGGGLFTEVSVARAEVDVGRVEESQQAG